MTAEKLNPLISAGPVKSETISDAPGGCARASGRAAGAPGASSNTPPPNSHWGTFTGGEDWFEWAAYVDWADGWTALRQDLERAKTFSQDKALCKQHGADLIVLNDLTLKVEGVGAKVGNVYMAYRVHAAGLVLLMAERYKAQGNMPNVILRAGGRLCLNLGAQGCLERGRSIIAELGGKIAREKLSRVDMCLDLPGVGMEIFTTAFQQRHFIGRARNRSLHESPGVTVALGKFPLMLRIYDKKTELEEHQNHDVLFMMERRRWHDERPERATRVEFELGRDALKAHGIDTPEDYFAKRADLAAYLCRRWVRFTAGPVDRRNPGRAPVLPLWAAVERGFAAWAGAPVGASLAPLDRQGVDVRALLKQAIGVTITAFAKQGRLLKLPEDFIAATMLAMRAILPDMNLAAEFARRMAEQG